MMQDKIYEKAIELGYVNAAPVTGHPFDVWNNRLKSIPLGQYLSFEHDPAAISGWTLDDITIWVAIAPTLDILVYQEPADKVYLQGLVAGTANLVTVLILGSLLALAYSKSRTRAGSLKAE